MLFIIHEGTFCSMCRCCFLEFKDEHTGHKVELLGIR